MKKYNSITSQSVLYFGELYEKRSGSESLHLFAGSKRIATVWLNGNIQFYHTDHLGSTNIVTDQDGEKKEWNEYFPFGTYRVSVDYASNFPDAFYTFTGQEDDDDLGLYNFKARLYDPVLGRFISPDTIVPDPTDPQSFNRYSYVKNNPLNYKDPSGKYGFFAHFFGTLIADIIEGLSILESFSRAWNDVMVDIKVKDPNLHQLRTEQQTIKEAQQAANVKMREIMMSNKPAAEKAAIFGHSKKDSVHGWGIDPRSIFGKIIHFADEMFNTIIDIGKVIKIERGIIKGEEEENQKNEPVVSDTKSDNPDSNSDTSNQDTPDTPSPDSPSPDTPSPDDPGIW